MASVFHRIDQPAAAQAGELVRDDLAGHLKGIGEVGRNRRGFAQGKQDLHPSRVGERVTEPGEGFGVAEDGMGHGLTIQQSLDG